MDTTTFACRIATNGARSRIVMPDLIHQVVVRQGARSVLDIGCGTGDFFGRHPWPDDILKWGIDSNPGMLFAARRKCVQIPNISFGLTLPSSEEGQFDAVTMFGVWSMLHRAKDCHDVLALAASAMKESGVFYAVVTNPARHTDGAFSNFSMGWGRRCALPDGCRFPVHIKRKGEWKRLRDNTHWSLRAMLAQLSHAGLILEAIKKYPDVVPKRKKYPWVLLIARKQRLG